MNKKFLLFSITIFMFNLLNCISKQKNKNNNNVTKSEQTKTNVTKSKEKPKPEIFKILQRASSKEEFYKNNLIFARILYDGIVCNQNYIEALQYCEIAMKGKNTKTKAEKLFKKIITKLITLLATKEKKIEVILDVKQLEELIKKILENIIKKGGIHTKQSSPPPGMYI
ncbi:hypothetical protein KAT08_01400 [Candidatus Babeliales bacterium]|nr:hypothetical protein [Candidatus Babeliales bacterium]